MHARRHHLARALMGLGLAAMAGCNGIVEPPWWTHQTVMYALLNADFTEHPILLVATDTASSLSEVSIAIHRRARGATDEEWELIAYWDSILADAAGRPIRDHEPCMNRLGSMPSVRHGMRDHVCMTPEAALEPGGVYRVEARARDRNTATGIARVVGGFEIGDAVLSGAEDAATLSASWTPSLAAHRYIVSFRSDCAGSTECDPWHAEADTNTIGIRVPKYAIDNALTDPMTLDVVAFDEHLHAFLTTGHSGIAFDVPPVQNVEGGFGVVGSLRFRERAVTGSR